MTVAIVDVAGTCFNEGMEGDATVGLTRRTRKYIYTDLPMHAILSQ